MKILFAIQGTGNGHLSRARDIYPELVKYGDVDVLVSGIQADVKVPFPVKYRYHGFGFMFGKKGGLDIWQTIKTTRLVRLIKDITRFPIEQYDLVVNDFEPVSAWACKLKGLPCVSLSHQCAVIHKDAARPEKSDWRGTLVLKNYAPVTECYGFHFNAFAENIFTPVIRKQVRETPVSNNGHYTVYLPAYSDDLLAKHLSKFKGVKWQVFSKHNKMPFLFENVQIQPIENDQFIKSMASAAGVLCGGGFEGPAEALYLGKKLLVIPMQDQYEQQCNAAALENMGVLVIDKLTEKNYSTINEWLQTADAIKVNYPDQTGEIVARMIRDNNERIRNAV